MNNKFRVWLQNIWLDNCEEHRQCAELPYSMQEYFQKYKFWLKREYKYQQRKQRIEQNDIAVAVNSNFIMGAILDDKLDSTQEKLLSKSQNKLIRTLKDNNEK